MTRKPLEILSIALLIILLGGVGAAAYVYHQVFAEDPALQVIDVEAYKTVSAEYVGDYGDTRAAFEEFEKKIAGGQIACERRFAAFYASLLLAPKDKRYYRVGCTVKDIPSKLPEGLLGEELPARPHMKMAAKPYETNTLDGLRMIAAIERRGAMRDGPSYYFFTASQGKVDGVEILLPMRQLVK